MGMFYTNLVLYKAQQIPVANFLCDQKRITYISPTIRNFTVVYDRETEDQNTRVLRNLAESISKKLKCSVLASLVHDSDLYLYWLYGNGKLLDSYNSLPGYFDAKSSRSRPEGGNARKLCKAFDKMEAVEKVRQIFALVEQGNTSDDWSEEYLLGENIHKALAQALDMPAFSVYTGYFSILNMDLPEELDLASLIKCPPDG